MKRLQCAKCGIVYWTELQVEEALIGIGEWIKNICPKCSGEWAIAEPGRKARRISPRKMAKLTGRRRALPKEAPEKAISFKGPRIKSLRHKFNLSQRDLAKLIEVTPWAIVSWEKGRFKPRKDRIAKLVELAGKSKEEVKNLLSAKTAPPKENKSMPGKKSKGKGI